MLEGVSSIRYIRSRSSFIITEKRVITLDGASAGTKNNGGINAYVAINDQRIEIVY